MTLLQCDYIRHAAGEIDAASIMALLNKLIQHSLNWKAKQQSNVTITNKYTSRHMTANSNTERVLDGAIYIYSYIHIIINIIIWGNILL